MSWFGRRTSESPRPDTFEHFTAPYSPDVDLTKSPNTQPTNTTQVVKPVALPVSTANTTSSKRAAMSFAVTKLPGPDLVFTNYVYINPQHSNLFKYSDRPNYVLLNQTHVFIVQSSDLIQPNTIGINSMQRNSVGVAENEPVAVQAYKISKEEAAGLLRVKADLYQARPRRMALKEVDVTKHLQKFYSGQVFSRGQVFAADLGFGATQFTIKSLEAANMPGQNGHDEDADEDISKYVERGLILSGTEWELECTDDPKVVKFEKNNSNKRSKLLNPDWKFEDMGIGGLDKEFSSLFRRAFASRLFPPEVIAQLGVKHVKGMILYGPPGTGKTLIARQIGKMLAGKEPKVVNGPEILNKFVGASEENIRKLFADAEADYAANKENSELHIIIFDEIDAICKARGSTGGGTGVHDTVVNQLLTKIDGVDSPNNILVIGMTNRKDMLDPALLRPGRLEVHVEISLPDEGGRLQIFKIHTNKMRENGKLSPDVNLKELAALTKNFSGAEIEGLVKSATSYALYGHVDVAKGNITAKASELNKILVTHEHFLAALDEVTPAFGVAEDELKNLIRGQMLDYGVKYDRLVNNIRTQIRLVANPDNANTALHSVLLHGLSGSGKTAVAAKLALESGFPFVKLVSPDQFIGMGEANKSHEINRVFEDAYKSPLSLIILDDIERLLEYTNIGPRFANGVLQTLQVLIKRVPPKTNRKLLIIGTSTDISVLEDMQLTSGFNVKYQVPLIGQPQEVNRVFEEMKVQTASPADLNQILATVELPVAIKQLQLIIEMAKQDKSGGSDATVPVTAERFVECMLDVGLQPKSSTNDMADGQPLTQSAFRVSNTRSY